MTKRPDCSDNGLNVDDEKDDDDDSAPGDRPMMTTTPAGAVDDNEAGQRSPGDLDTRNRRCSLF